MTFDLDPYWAEAIRLLETDPHQKIGSDYWDRKDIPAIADALRTKDARIDRLEFAQSTRETILLEERDAYKKLCEQIGVCMTCAIRAPEPYGCSDCLNTGWQQGVPLGYIDEAKFKIAEEALERIASKSPATQEMTLAHEMADDADQALVEISGTHR